MHAADFEATPSAALLAQAAKALADPMRLEMLALMSRGSDCCPVPAEHPGQRPPGVCVCEIQQLLGLAQSRVSYHLRVLKEAGLISEANRGKWAFYSVNTDAVESVLARLRETVLGRSSGMA
ncbi:MAG: ArsR/SmtB family transcription factor [Chloroflexota bacterium]